MLLTTQRKYPHLSHYGLPSCYLMTGSPIFAAIKRTSSLRNHTLMNLLEWHDTGIYPTDIGNSDLREITIANKLIGMVQRAGQVHAFAGKCPHAGAPLCSGWLDAQGRIVCPLHKYRFDPVNGRNTSGEGYKLFTYPTRVQDGTIWVGIVPPVQ